ncbi:unnamed protein product [Acanthoscelides obtectus]|uniref:Uncharacterized protein n=1 Tax=Acanthoscelides obtectus TaxID=200917 RepID=A0A9P0KQD1_ACAOB|nr:unnamed protein product [Acanthoscelides obtectus]CAK1641888.1 hypothetical protein AOBTE_LOCUS12698 [Acanthoscelides obtectus]
MFSKFSLICTYLCLVCSYSVPEYRI